MKKIFSLFILFFAIATIAAQAQSACCPEFKLAFKRDFDCTKTGPCVQNGPAGDLDPYTGSNCKYSTNSFLVVPNLPGYSYSWTVTGGIPSSTTTNPISITWLGGNTGTITVTITSNDGKCVKTIKEKICLRDAPVASFTFGPNNACAGTLITFNNTSTGGASVSWDFAGLGFAGNVNSPTFIFPGPGTYPVTIYVTNDTTPCVPTTPQPGSQERCCGCTSSFTMNVTVLPGSPLLIVPKECVNQCLCAGDTAEYCLSTPCPGPINWTVNGGTIISGAGTPCIKVKWTGPYPTSISVSAPNCGNPCGNTATLNVPVLVSGIPILPNVTTVCQFSTQTYSLPAMPGVFYNWSVTGGTIVGPNTNTSTITVLWGAGPTGTVSCTYQNPLKKNCSGTSTRNVTIKPVLKLTGPTQSCEGCTVMYMTAGGSVNWSISPSIPLTPISGPSTNITFPVTGSTTVYTLTASGTAYCNSPVSASITVAPKPVLTITPPSATACPGTQIKFVATSNVTTSPISWTLPAGATMVANTGPQLDTAVIQFGPIPGAGAIVTASQYCAFNQSCSQGTASVTVTKPPAPSLSSPVYYPCIDQTQSYSISNYNAGITYTWAITNNLGTIVSGQGTGSINVLWHGNLSTANQGVLTVTNCSGTASANITVTIPVLPTITVSGTCIKNGMTLTSSAGAPYAWTGPGIVGATNTQTININQPGTYCVTINATGSGSCPQQKCITIPPNPYWVKIIPPCIVSSCNPANLNVLFTVSTNIPGATNCQWLYQPPGGGGYTVVSTTCGNYTGTLLGSYFMVITDPNGCKDTSNIIRIPQDINICCTTPVCSALSATTFNFTFSGCQPTAFTGTPLSLPPGWTTGTLHPTICYGDGTAEDFITLNTTHQYPAAGTYTACVVQKVVKTGTNDTCCISSCKQVVIPVVTKFTASYDCNTGLLTMTDGSTYYPNATGANYTWTYSGAYTGTLTNGPNQTITPTASGTFTITLSIVLNGCTSVYSLPILIVLPTAPITITPNPSCDGAPVSFTTTAGMASYNWKFGDSSFSMTQSPQHIYPGPGTYTVILTVVTPEGCTVTNTATVTIQPRPIVTVTPNPVTICPGSSVTLTASINANGNTMCPTLSSYTFQWYNNGVALGAPTVSPTFTTSNYGTYYAVLTSTAAGCNCVITTDTVTVKWYPAPIAKIKGKSSVCLSFGTGTVALQNEAIGYPGYNWSSSNPGNISFDDNTIYNPVLTINAPGNYQVYLEVTDANGCKAYDTLCLYTTNSPQVTINGPGGTLCSGNVYNLTSLPSPPTAPPAGYAYLWSNGASANNINVSAPGVYSLILTDLNTGCSALSNPIFVNSGPDLSLFPSCCDTICDNAPIDIIPPLPLAPGQNVCTVYNIVWLDNGVPISPQPSPCNILNTSTLVPLLGLHNISIAVTINGCTDTSNVFMLYIKHCGDCDCKGSHWGETVLNEGDQPGAKSATGQGDPVHGVVVKRGVTEKMVNNDPQGGNPIYVQCGSNQKLDCSKTYTLSSTYNCADTACTAKVTFSLQPPSGPAITGTNTITFTTNLTGTYVLTMYGWCGDKKCDSCTIKFEVKCCDCKGSKWDKITLTKGQQLPDPKDNPTEVGAAKAVINNNNNPVALNLNCGKTYKLDCNKPYTVNAGYICNDAACPGTVTYKLQTPSGTTTGTIPPALTFTPTLSGTYTLTMYGWCGNTICDSCVIKFEVECVNCDCKGSKWGEQTVTIDNNTKNFKCGNGFEVKCKKPITVNANYFCADQNCNAAVTYSLQPPTGGPTTGNLPLTFTPLQNGTYTLTMYGWCGTKICDSCVIKFTAICEPEECCPYKITASTGTVKYDYTQIPNATVAAQTFSISGLSLASISEVRANVISYDITDNFGKECMKCVNLPFTWASVQSAANIGTTPGLITMYGGASVATFNGSGTGAYQNPREVIWNNGSPINIPNGTNIGMNFILPPVPAIDCCELKGKICVKFTFRDKDCRECEVIACFDFVMKKK
ncbi:MAG: PKD domain-containing protein [Chitinophagaceae bacterium]|nr:PKD domain-containing protein [Chitinophagaceae bacterium]